jgi:hypothetical protein
MNVRFRFHGDAFRAGRPQLIPSSLRSGGMDLRLVLHRPGVAPCPLQLTVKRQSRICLLIKKPLLDIIHSTCIEGKFHSYRRPFSCLMVQGFCMSVSVKAPCCFWSACGSSACRGESMRLPLRPGGSSRFLFPQAS